MRFDGALGGQRVGIARDIPALDGNGDPVRDTLGDPTGASTEVIVWVDGCLFETQSTGENEQEVSTEALERAWCFMPVSGGLVLAVDDSGAPAPIAVSDIASDARIEHGGRTYQMSDHAVIEFDLDGHEDHVFCRCERKRSG